MKILYTLLFALFFIFNSNAQDNKDIANIYLSKAKGSFEANSFEKAIKYLNKAETYYGSNKSLELYFIGANLHFKQKNFEAAKEYSKKYFSLQKNKKGKYYEDMLLLFTEIEEGIDEIPVKEKKPKTTVQKSDSLNSILKEIDVNELTETTDKDEVEEILEEEIVEDVSFMIIENAPVYPGCTGSRTELKNCFSRSVQRHFANNFNSNLPNQLGLSAGRKRVFIGFKIDKTGNVVNIIARAPHPKIKEEVIRVMSLMPQMKPGTQRGKSIGVKYSIPFTLIVEGEVKKKD